jgi:hypothetical protein
MRRDGWTDEQVEQLLGWVLQVGVVLAALVELLGGAAYLLGHGLQPYDFRSFRGAARGGLTRATWRSWASCSSLPRPSRGWRSPLWRSRVSVTARTSSSPPWCSSCC